MATETDLETGPERRRFCRRSISEFQLLTADVTPVGSEREQSCLVLNISECGLAVQPFQRLSPGNLVELRFDVPGAGKALTSKGMVAWTGSGGPAGIQLTDMASGTRERLRKWVDDDLGLTPPQPSASDAYAVGPGAQEFESALHLIAKRAQVVTRANGAALALGDARSMVCRASTGVAPALGVPIRSGLGLAGQCLCTGRLVQSSDAQFDSRIDPVVARQLQLGSAVIIPIYSSGALTGALAVFSRHPRAFDEFHIRRLERLAAVVTGALQTPAAAPPEAQLKPGASAKSARPDSRSASPSLTAKNSAAAPAVHPLHHLASLWDLIEPAQPGQKSSTPGH